MTFDLWKVESYIYALIEATGMRGNSSLKETFDIGENFKVDLKIHNFAKEYISIHTLINIDKLVLSLNFRDQDNQCWFRVDNESRDKGEKENYLHFHLEEGNKKFNHHQKLKDEYIVSELISFTFDWLYKIIPEKFERKYIEDSSGFVGMT
jgi:hypothetical protein